MSGMYGPSDESESIATIHAALDGGVTLLDTGDFYGMGHNEMLLGRALQRPPRSRPALGEIRRPAHAHRRLAAACDGRPQAVRNFLAYTLQRLGTDHIDIYRLARLDPAVPIEDTVGAIADMVKAGHVRYIGLSEVGADTVRRARAVQPICDLQIEYSLISRGIEERILPAVRELGIAVTAYGVLSRGLLTASPIAAGGDLRARLPRFQTGNLEQNRSMAEALAAFAAERGATAAQLAIAWVAARGDDIVPVVGARTRAQLAESVGALDVRLTPEDLAHLEAICNPHRVAGTRYDPAQMRLLDSEG